MSPAGADYLLSDETPASGYEVGDTVRLKAVVLTQRTRGSIDSGSSALSVASSAGYANGDAILVEGAGPEGSDLVTTVSAIAGATITLADAARTTVRRATVGKLTDPTPSPPTFTLLKPDRTSSAPAVTREAVGRFVADVVVDQHGTHHWRANGGGAAPGAGESAFTVKHSRFL